MISCRRALLQSLLSLLRTGAGDGGFGLKDNDTGLTSAGGNPPGTSGNWFYGLYSGGSFSTAGTSLIEQPSVYVALSARVRGVPADRIGALLLESEGGLDDRVATLTAFLANNQHVWMYMAKTLMSETPNDGLFLPAMSFQDGGPREVGADWWLAANVSPGLQTAPAVPGLVQTLTISGFRRERYLETAT